jgi:2-phospho-L-lactate guanylyltransferase
MHALVPFDGERPKTRLSPVLDADERRAFATAMLDDVVEAVREAGHDPTVLATGPVDVDAPVETDERPLTPAVNAVLDRERPDRDDPLAVVAADLALATPAAVSRLAAADGDVVLAPGLGGGTNALVVGAPGFRVDFHGVSYRDHRRAAERVGATTTTVDSLRLSTDVDEPADLVEVLLHGEGRAPGWLREAGFELDAGDGRVRVRRRGDGEE